eukprot:UN10700
MQHAGHHMVVSNFDADVVKEKYSTLFAQYNSTTTTTTAPATGISSSSPTHAVALIGTVSTGPPTQYVGTQTNVSTTTATTVVANGSNNNDNITNPYGNPYNTASPQDASTTGSTGASCWLPQLLILVIHLNNNNQQHPQQHQMTTILWLSHLFNNNNHN